MISAALRFLRELYDIWRTSSITTFGYYFFVVLISLPQIILKRSLNPADKKMAGRYCSFRPFGEEISIKGDYFGVVRDIYCRKCYFIPTNFGISLNDLVVDLGANAGVFTILAALHADKVIAVEAQSLFIPELETNLANNKLLHKVHIEFGLIGSGTGVFSDEARLKASSHYGIPPPAVSFSEMMHRHQIEWIDFLKVDIEGSEFDLFTNNTSWLAKVHKIAMEVHLNFGDPNMIAGILANYGFKTMFGDTSGKIVNFLNGPVGFLFAEKR